MPEPLPSKIGRYEIQRELGRGMMGIVYEAFDPALDRRIALKTIQLAFTVSEDDRRSFEQRFLTEARVAARLSHPGIVVVHDVGQDPATGTLYIALEFLKGHTLAEVVGAGEPMDWREALEITRRVARALHHAHAEGVIHRDVKPANIMILPSGEAKIMDFGIARVETSQLTATGQFFGTPLYMSPEQALGRRVDARSDLFSLGSVAYALLTGRQPFEGAAVPLILMRVMQDDPAPPTRLVPDLPPDVDYLLARALAKDPADRYADGQAMAEDIEDVLAGVPPRHQKGWEPPPAGEGTLVASAASDDAGREGHARSTAEPRTPSAAGDPLSEPGSPGVPRSRGAAPASGAREPSPWGDLPWRLAAVAALALVAVAIGTFLRGRPGTEPGGASPTPAVAAPAATADTRSPARAAEPPVRTVVPSESAPGQARIDLVLEHSLKHGRLRVWVDDALAVEEGLDSRVKKLVEVEKVGALKIRKGRLEQTLEIPAGRHEIRVEVAWDDHVKTGRIWANFRPGSTRRLSAKIGTGITGLVKKDLDLEWK